MPALPRNVYRTPYGFQFRIVVPEPLRGLIGQREIKKALGRDYRLAVSKARSLAAEVDQQFAWAREQVTQAKAEQDALQLFQAAPHLKPITRVTPELVEGLKSLWLLGLKEDLPRRREGLDDEDYEGLQQNVAEMRQAIAQVLARGQPERYFPALEVLLVSRGYELRVSPAEERRLTLDVLQAFQQGYDILEQRQAGRLAEPDLTQAAAPLPAAWEPPPVPSQPDGMSWEALFEHWKRDRSRAQSTIDDVELAMRSLMALFPDSSPVTPAPKVRLCAYRY